MALKIAELYAELRADTSGFVNSVNKTVDAINSAAAKVENRWTKLSENMGKAGSYLSTRVTLPIIGAFGASVAAASEAEDAIDAVASALRRGGANVDYYVKRIDELSNAIQRQTVYDDEAIKRGAALAINMGISADRIEEVTKAAVGLAAAYRIDLETAFKLIGRAAAGNTAMLGRYGIVIDDTLSKEEKFNRVLELGASGFSIAESRAQTMSGSLLQAKNAMTDAAETIGAAFAPFVRAAADVLKSFAVILQSISPTTRKWIITLGLAAAAVGPLLIAISSLINAYRVLASTQLIAMAIAGGPAGWATLAVGIATATTLVWALNKAFSQTAQSAEGVADAVGQIGAKTKEAVIAEQIENVRARIEESKKRIAKAAAWGEWLFGSVKSWRDYLSRLQDELIALVRRQKGLAKEKQPAIAAQRATEEELQATKQILEARKQIYDMSRGWTTIGELWKRSMSISSKMRETTTPAVTFGAADVTAAYAIARRQLESNKRQEEYLRQLLGIYKSPEVEYGE